MAQPKQSKNSTRDSRQQGRIRARQKRREAQLEEERLLQEQRALERRQQTVIGAVTAAIIVIAIAVIAGTVIYNNIRNSKAGIRDSAYAAMQAVKNKPSYANSEGGFVFSKNGIGKKVKGAPTVEDYMDFICPACGSANRALDATFIKMVDSGQLNLEVYPEGFLDASSTDNYSTRAAAAAIYVIQNDPNHALQFISKMFSTENQPQEASGYVPVTNARIQQIAKDAGVDADVAKKCTDGTYTEWVRAAAKYTPYRSELWNVSGSNKGSMTTPTFRINGHYWDFSRATGPDWQTNLLRAIGMKKTDIGIAGKMPSIGSDKGPIY